MITRAAAVLVTLTIAACTPAPAADAARDASAPCAKVGQSCAYAPNKLGSCVQRDDCAGDGCFVCQSQH